MQNLGTCTLEKPSGHLAPLTKSWGGFPGLAGGREGEIALSALRWLLGCKA